MLQSKKCFWVISWVVQGVYLNLNNSVWVIFSVKLITHNPATQVNFWVASFMSDYMSYISINIKTKFGQFSY